MSKCLLFLFLALSLFNPTKGYSAAASSGITSQVSNGQKEKADMQFKMQHRLARAENFMAKHRGGLADNAGLQLLLYMLVTVGTIFLIFWLGSKLSGVPIGPIFLIVVGIFLLYSLYRLARGYKTLFKSY